MHPLGFTSLSNRENHLGAHTAVDQERGAGDVRGLVREQVRDATRDVGRLPDLAERHLGVDGLAHGGDLRLRHGRPHEWRVDRFGGYGVEPNSRSTKADASFTWVSLLESAAVSCRRLERWAPWAYNAKQFRMTSRASRPSSSSKVTLPMIMPPPETKTTLTPKPTYPSPRE